jgi:hypothetical protein
MAELQRREFLTAAALLGLAPVAYGSGRQEGAAAPAGQGFEHWPRQEMELVRETVGASHRDLKRVRELVEARPALANAAWDWGFGDWETALGAASHTGQREIALLLIGHGARPDIFTFAMLGNAEAVRAMVEAQPELAKLDGPHGIPLLRHAEAGSEIAEYLRDKGASDTQPEPMAPEVVEKYTGTYRVENGGPEFVIKPTRRGPAFERAPQAQRGLLPVDEHEFHPVGTRSVRLKFELANEKAAQVTIRDHDFVLAAQRIG